MEATLKTRTLFILTLLSAFISFVLCQIISEVPIDIKSTLNASELINASQPVSVSSQESTVQPNTKQTSRGTSSVPLYSTAETATTSNLNNNDPVFKQESYITNVKESIPVNSIILQVVALDEDQGDNGNVTYRIEGNQQVLDTFTIEQETGRIVLLNRLNHTRTSVYDFEVVAVDGGVIPRYGRARVVVVVNRNNNRPTFEEMYYDAKVKEDVPLHTSILQVVATDDDQGPNGEITYSFVDDSNEDGVFAIEKMTGLVSTAGDLHWNQQNKYVLVVQASDQGSPPLLDTTQIYITILKSDITVKPLKGDIIFTGGAALFISDPTKDDDITDVTTVAMTTINPTTIKAVTTSNIGTHPPPNLHHPVFTQSSHSWTIAEDAEIGSLVAVVTALDEDDGISGQVKYSLEPEDISEFTIDEQSGTVKVAESLSNSRGSSFYFSIIARDMSPEPKSSSVDVEVIIADINNHAPVFEKEFYEARVREDALRYSRVIKITAADADTGRNGRIRYIFQPGKNGGGTFAIDRSLGIIRLLKLLDREQRSSYDLIVEASDSGVPKQTTQVGVRVIIADVNDNAPKFPSYYLRMYIRENGQPFQLVGTIQAKDEDIGVNADVRYAMLLDTVDAYKFQLDFRTGDLHALNSLDREEQSEYRVTVRAASPPLFSQAIVIIYVLDENDNPPVAHNSTIFLNFYGDYLPEHKVGHLGASDPDASTELTFKLQDGSYTDLFRLNQSTGELYVANKLLTRYIPRTVVFTVDVTDGLFNTSAEVVIHTARVSIDMLTNSLTLHLMAKMYAANFVTSKNLQTLLDIVASILDVELEDVFILSLFDEIYPHIPPAINMTLVARMRNGTYFSTAQLRARIALEQKQLWELAAVLPPVDKLCVYEMCAQWSNCKGVPAYKYTIPTVINPLFSFMSVKWDREYHCICPPGYSGRRCDSYYDFCNDDPCQRYGECKTTEQGAYCLCDEGYFGDNCEVDVRIARCPANICKNNGTCIEGHYGGFYCSCPQRLEGQGFLCEGTTRTFPEPGSFLAFEELGWHSQLNIRLSFRTLRSNGLILYNARSNRNQHDFIALEVVNRQLIFSFSLGELYTRVPAGLFGPGVSDGEWHDVQINYVRQHVLVGVDSCIHWVETLEPDEYLQWNVGNRTCLGYGAQVGGVRNLRFFDLDGPLFLGAAQNYWFGLAVSNKDFVGCIRDVYIDYQHLDLNNYIKENSTLVGCDLRYNDPCADGECNQADGPPIHLEPVRKVRIRSWAKAIQVIWKPPKQPPIPLEGYEVRYTEVYDGIPSDWRTAQVPEGDGTKRKRRIKIRKLEENTLYVFEIRPYGKNIYGEEVRVNATTGIRPETVQKGGG